MRRRLRIRLSYANVVASLALFAALGGSSYAAIKLPAGSVGPKQLRAGAVSSSKVTDGSLAGRDFRPGVLARAPAGPAGPAGKDGQPGPKGDTGSTGAPGRSALEPLQSGETIRGVVGGDDHASVGISSADFGVVENFPIPAPAPVSEQNVVVDAGDDDGANRCTGTADAPSAPPGVVCIYVETAHNATALNGLGVPTSAGSRFGFELLWVAPNADDTIVIGKWAYQAP